MPAGYEYPVRIDTIGKLIDFNLTLSVYCHRYGCGHSARLDLEALADRLGRDHPSMARALLPRLTCTKCGGNVKRGDELSLRCGWDFRHAPRPDDGG